MEIDINRAMAEFSYGLPITIEGIGLATEVTNIPQEAVFFQRPKISTEVFERGDAYFRILKDGSEIQLSPAERHRMVLEDNGWVLSGNITWKIVDQQVSCYCIKGAL